MGNLGFPFFPVHPGELLKEELECRHISQRAFATKYGVSYTTLNEVLNGKRPVTTEFALFMEAALGVEPGLLLRMQTSYNLQVAKKDKKLIDRFNEIRKISAIL
jgi:addiction module HigA family antidote